MRGRLADKHKLETEAAGFCNTVRQHPFQESTPCMSPAPEGTHPNGRRLGNPGRPERLRKSSLAALLFPNTNPAPHREIAAK